MMIGKENDRVDHKAPEKTNQIKNNVDSVPPHWVCRYELIFARIPGPSRFTVAETFSFSSMLISCSRIAADVRFRVCVTFSFASIPVRVTRTLFVTAPLAISLCSCFQAFFGLSNTGPLKNPVSACFTVSAQSREKADVVELLAVLALESPACVSLFVRPVFSRGSSRPVSDPDACVTFCCASVSWKNRSSSSSRSKQLLVSTPAEVSAHFMSLIETFRFGSESAAYTHSLPLCTADGLMRASWRGARGRAKARFCLCERCFLPV
mmetsp:Transcript_18868/g.41334  ORF Transcript_18868/g.41334 Transcript_18868/m.41334 type:complete len:265 (-) Transcript_18868:68-862(-)